jgi:hypothetical protein
LKEERTGGMKMSGNSRVKYETALKLYHRRKELEESIVVGNCFSDLFDERWDDFHERITPIQSQIFMFLELGLSLDWIREHMEYDRRESRESWSYHLRTLRSKLQKFLEERKDV